MPVFGWPSVSGGAVVFASSGAIGQWPLVPTLPVLAGPALSVPAQTDLTGGGPLAIVVTFVLTALFYAVTLHLAAVFYLGDVPSQRAVAVSPVPAIVTILLGRYGGEVVVPVTLLGDLVAISAVYRLRWRTAAALTLLHFAFAAILGVAIGNLLGLL
jgi:hypothetical protein